MLSFFPRGVLDEILNLIESVSEGFPSYSYLQSTLIFCKTTDIFYATKENNVLNLTQKLKSMNYCTVSECFDKFLSNCLMLSIFLVFSVLY